MVEQNSQKRELPSSRTIPAAAAVTTSSSKRASTATSKQALTKPPTEISPSAVIADKAILSGTHMITIGTNSVIHPYAKIVSNYGPVTIGDNVVINEKAIVGQAPHDESSNVDTGVYDGVIIEDNVNIGSSSVVEASVVGEGSTIDVEAKVGTGATIGKFCKLSVKSVVAAGGTVQDYITVSHGGHRREDYLLKQNSALRVLRLKRQNDQVELLRRLIPSNLAKWS
ncbi:MAG: hypothetical protein M1820_000391 [Bogoriella megaspora]|nr:MAG: hypothetical protein M1820_000391 [Bogoriella megaspora]